jgi:HK97 family phage major capsid protein
LNFAKEFPEYAKTLIYSGQTGITTLIEPQVLQQIIRADERERRVRDAFMTGATDSTAITYVRENVVTNNAGAIVEATSITAGAPGPAGAKFPESAITFVAATETIKNVGHMIPVTKEMLQDIPLMQSYIRARMIEMLDDKIDLDLVAGAGGNSLVGLQNVSGLSVLDATYWAANPLHGVAQPAENADRLRHARTYLRVVAKARPTDILLNPYDLEDMMIARDDNGNYLFGGTVGQNGTLEARTGGLNIIETDSTPENTAYVISRNVAAVYDKLETTVEVTDSNRDWWEYRILALAVWARLALVVYRPAAIAQVTLL